MKTIHFDKYMKFFEFFESQKNFEILLHKPTLQIYFFARNDTVSKGARSEV